MCIRDRSSNPADDFESSGMGTQALVKWIHKDGREYMAPGGSWSPKKGVTGWERAPIETFQY